MDLLVVIFLLHGRIWIVGVIHFEGLTGLTQLVRDGYVVGKEKLESGY